MAENDENWCDPAFDFGSAWRNEVRDADQELRASGDYNDAWLRERDALMIALPRYLFECYCEHVRYTRGRPGSDLPGRRAAELIAVEKYGWLPDKVRMLSRDDLTLALHAEIFEGPIPQQAIDAMSGWFNQKGMSDHISPLRPQEERA